MSIPLPTSAADARPGALPGTPGGPAKTLPAGAYIRNPLNGRDMLTRLEALNAISILSSVLTADEAYREGPADQRVFNGG